MQLWCGLQIQFKTVLDFFSASNQWWTQNLGRNLWSQTPKSRNGFHSSWPQSKYLIIGSCKQSLKSYLPPPKSFPCKSIHPRLSTTFYRSENIKKIIFPPFSNFSQIKWVLIILIWFTFTGGHNYLQGTNNLKYFEFEASWTD